MSDRSIQRPSSTLIYNLGRACTAPVSQIGGKAFNLNRMLDAGLAVPGGFVLPVAFFEPWLAGIRQTSAWQDFVSASSERLQACCEALKTIALDWPFDDTQTQALEEQTKLYPAGSVFAVRSSSPHEDLEGSSFAGAYESLLGVTLDRLEDSIRHVFASCLDARIEIYKRAHGLGARTPSIAVVVQLQIASEVSGVGFSINPLNNDHDEALYNANWGLGETVVAGLVTPDLFVVRKDTYEIIERNIGAKESSLWLQPGGGTVERIDLPSDQPCLDDTQIEMLTIQLQRVEAFFQQPSDIEWAFAKGELYLLQARPITTHLELPSSMMTAPGTSRRLYLDITISVQGVFEPLSEMGISVFRRLIDATRQEILGIRVPPPIDDALFKAEHGRLYIELINMGRLLGESRMLASVGQMDSLVQQALRERNLDDFARSDIKRMTTFVRAALRMPRRVPQFYRALRHPIKARDRWFEKWQGYKTRLCELSSSDTLLMEFIDSVCRNAIEFISRETLPLFPNAKLALARIRRFFPEPTDEIVALIDHLDRSLPGNVTVEMGHALFNLSELLSPHDAVDVNQLKRSISEGTAPAPFLDGWSTFLEKYGHRGIKEIDVAAPRYAEQPGLLLEQLVNFVQGADGGVSPIQAFETAQKAREAAFESLCARLPARKVARFTRLYRVLETLGGFRETHKFVMMYSFRAIRERLLAAGRELVAQGRLNTVEDVFHLEIEQLTYVLGDASLDVHALVAAGHYRYARNGQCKSVFPLVDSRGRFHRPRPKPAKPGELSGQGVAAGVARGRVKVLYDPQDQPIGPGDVLVARATDPAWTPLFVYAEAIVLEVGGPLQHGALVAREYGKPCVSGIQSATTTLRSGDFIEVDGNAGIVRRLPEASDDTDLGANT